LGVSYGGLIKVQLNKYIYQFLILKIILLISTMIEDEIIAKFENNKEVPTYNEICGAYVDIGKGFSEINIVETELKLALLLDRKYDIRDYHWDKIKQRWRERWC
jgi:hypothetical protein